MATNTITMRTLYAREFQDTHYKKSIYSLFADLRFKSLLKDGVTVSWDYDSDAVAGSLGTDDAYTISAKTITAETLTVNQKPFYGFFIPGSQKIQDHRPTQEKWAKKSMNIIINKIDGYILNLLRAGAASSLDNGDFGGSSGDPIAVTTGNAASIYTAARRVLKNQNVIYDTNKVFKNDVKLDSVEKMPVAAIPAELEEKLLLQIGFKDTGAADQVMKSGFMGMVFGFNTVTSNSLPFSFRYTFAAQPTNGKVLTIGGSTTTIQTSGSDGVAINWVTTIGTTAGNVLSETDATTSVGNLVDFCNDIYEGTTSAKYVGFTRASMSPAQQRILDGLSAVDNEDGSCVITIAGLGHVSVSDDDSNSTIDREAVHAIFGTSKSIGMVMQRNPEVAVSAGDLLSATSTTGNIGKHYVTWALFGAKVFKTQTYQLIDVPIASSAFTSPNQVVL